MEKAVFDRFPALYKEDKQGGAYFSEVAYLSEEHEKFLPQEYFPVVGSMTRHCAYKNKRTIDPFVKMYFEEANVTTGDDWGLPVPNEEASYMSLSKYKKDVPFMDNDQINDMNRAWRMTATHFGPYMTNSRVKGLGEVIEKLDRQTSSGAPYNKVYATKGDLLDNDPEIVTHLAENFEQLATDPNMTYLCTNSLKEEIRPAEKIVLNKIRTFAAFGIDATVDGNRLFSDMNEKMNSAWLSSASTVGWSPMNGNWALLLEKLDVFENGYALDESEYDSSLRSYMMWGCAHFRWSCLRDEDKTSANLQRIKTYYRNLVNSVLITPEGVLVMKLGGNPSGSVNTINDNTLILFTLKAYGWIRNHPDKENTDVGEFLSNVSMALCGDDNTWTVSDWAHDFYNATTLIATWKTIGITTTTDSLLPRRAVDLDYLSAKTVFLNGIAVPQYDRAKILTSLLYSSKTNQTPAQALTRACGMLVVGYTDIVLRRFLRQFISWLFERFDKVCSQDPEWIVAKTGYHSDDRLFQLWTGKSFYLVPQSYSAHSEKQENRIKIIMSVVMNQKKSQGGRRRGAKASRKQQQQQQRQKTNWDVQIPMGVSWAQPRTTRRARKGKKKRTNATKEKGFFEKAGDLLLAGAKHLIPMLAGFGDYEVKSNSLLSAGTDGKLGGEVPIMKNTRSLNIISHREYLGDVISTTDPFKVLTFPIQPGLSSTFPWLSPVANCYQQYRLRGAVVEFRSLATSYAALPNIGYVAMASQYDVLDEPYTSKLELENSEFSTSRKTDQSFIHPLECANSQTVLPEKYIRNGPVPTGGDKRMYDLCDVYLAVGGQPSSGAVIGELWISYEVEFLKPRLAGPPGFNSNSFQGVRNSTTNGAPFGVTWTSQTGNLGVEVAGLSLRLRLPPGGRYTMFLAWTGTAATCTLPPIASSSGFLTNPVYGSFAPGPTTPISTYVDLMAQIGAMEAVSDVQIINFTAGVIPAGSVRINVYQLWEAGTHHDIFKQPHMSGKATVQALEDVSTDESESFELTDQERAMIEIMRKKAQPL